jgi:hypothetical protein
LGKRAKIIVEERLSSFGEQVTWEIDQILTLQMTVTEGKPPATAYVGTGLPTYQELLDHYPARFTWRELKTFVNSGSVHKTVPIPPSDS